jgi:hypothetical protein
MSAATRVQIGRQPEELTKGLFVREIACTLDTHVRNDQNFDGVKKTKVLRLSRSCTYL